MNRQTAVVRTFGSRDKKRHKRVVNVVVAMTRKLDIRWSQASIKKFVRNRNQVYIRSRRLTASKAKSRAVPVTALA